MKWASVITQGIPQDSAAKNYATSTARFSFKTPARVRRIIASAVFGDATVNTQLVPDLSMQISDCDTAGNQSPFFKDQDAIKLNAGQYVFPQNFSVPGIFSRFTSKDGNIDLDFPCGPYVTGAIVIVTAVGLPLGADNIYFSLLFGIETKNNL